MPHCNRMAHSTFFAALALFLGQADALAGGVQRLDLSGLEHGDVVSGTTINGVTIGVNNFDTNNGPRSESDSDDYAVIFDSRETPTRDSDLEDPFSLGNLAGRIDVGNLVIIQETGVPTSTPDDEGSRPAGNLFFDFDRAVTSFGFDLIDVEEVGEFDEGTGFVATFVSGDEAFQVGFREFAESSIANSQTEAATFFDPSVVFGNNSANRISPITAAQFGLTSFDSVTVNFGGSAGIANINFTPVPSPSAVAGSLIGVVGLGCVSYRQRRRRGA